MSETKALEELLENVDYSAFGYTKGLEIAKQASAELDALLAAHAELKSNLQISNALLDMASSSYALLRKQLDEAIRVIEQLRKCSDLRTSWAQRYYDESHAFLERMKIGGLK